MVSFAKTTLKNIGAKKKKAKETKTVEPIQDLIPSGLYRGMAEHPSYAGSFWLGIEVRVDFEGDTAVSIISGDIFHTLVKDEIDPQVVFPIDKLDFSFIVRAFEQRTKKSHDVRIVRCFVDTDCVRDVVHDLTFRILPGNEQKVILREFRPPVLDVPLAPLKYEFDLKRVGSLFRRVDLHVHQVAGTELPPIFENDVEAASKKDKTRETKQVASAKGLDRRKLHVEGAFAAAGIELRVSRSPQVISPALADSQNNQEVELDVGRWNDAELHEAMARAEDFVDKRAWRGHLIVATAYREEGVVGRMFDRGFGLPRQGVALFAHELADLTGDLDYERRRQRYLYVAVHEIGHAFNLVHSFEGSRVKFDAMPPRPDAASWMNYARYYPLGWIEADFLARVDKERFWRDFDFRFDRHELTRLRHGAFSDVAMGTLPFAGVEPDATRPFERPRSGGGLDLDLILPHSVEFMEPVKGYIRLRNRSPTEVVRVHSNLSLESGHLELLIRRHDGGALALSDSSPARRYAPFARNCSRIGMASSPDSGFVELEPDQRAYHTVMPSFGREWFIDAPGRYDIQATYCTPDGSRLASTIRLVEVAREAGRTAERLASDVFQSDVGLYLAIGGGIKGGELERKVEYVLDQADSRMPNSLIARELRGTKLVSHAQPMKKPFAGAHTFRESLTEVESDDVQQADGYFEKARDAQPTLQRLKTCAIFLTNIGFAAVRGYDWLGDRKGRGSMLTRIKELLNEVGAPKEISDRISKIQNHRNPGN